MQIEESFSDSYHIFYEEIAAYYVILFFPVKGTMQAYFTQNIV